MDGPVAPQAPRHSSPTFLQPKPGCSAGNQHTRDSDDDGYQGKKHAEIHGAESSVTPVIQGAKSGANPPALAGVESKTSASHAR